jgi:hypothetical protein
MIGLIDIDVAALALDSRFVGSGRVATDPA